MRIKDFGEYNEGLLDIFKKKSKVKIDPIIEEDISLQDKLGLPPEKQYKSIEINRNAYGRDWKGLFTAPLLKSRVNVDISDKVYQDFKDRLSIIADYVASGKFKFPNGYFCHQSYYPMEISISRHYEDGIIVTIYNDSNVVFPMYTIRDVGDDYYLATLSYRDLSLFFMCDTIDGFLQLFLDYKYDNLPDIDRYEMAARRNVINPINFG